MTKKAQHVVPREGGWAVRSSGAARVAGRFPTQDEAVQVARDRARAQGTILFIHGSDGRVREMHNYESAPPKG